MTRILYISMLDPVAPRAHVYNTLQTVAALSRITPIRLIIPRRSHARDAQAHIREYLGIAGQLPLSELESWGARLSGGRYRIVNWMETTLIALSFCKMLFLRRNEFDLLYLRDFSLFLPALFAKYVLRKPFAYEVHAVLHARKQEWRNSLLVRHASTVNAITNALAEHYAPTQPHITTIVCAAAEPERFAAVRETRAELRRAFSIPADAVVLGYTGNMGRTGNNDPYGIEEIIDALPYLDRNVMFIGYGRRASETEALESHIATLGLTERALIRGHVSKADVYRFLAACDVLVIPSAGNQIGNAPSKTYEYLASDLPIVAARTVANTEILKDGMNALIVEAKDPADWARAIRSLTTDANLSKHIVAGARATAHDYTWDARARKIMAALRT